MIRQIQVGDVPVGGGAPVSIQSMLNTKTTDVEGSLRQLEALKAAGCQIARLAVPNEEAARGFREIAAQSPRTQRKQRITRLGNLRVIVFFPLGTEQVRFSKLQFLLQAVHKITILGDIHAKTHLP